MIDITSCRRRVNEFGGSELKSTIEYNGDVYMIKFPDPVRKKGNSLVYINNQFSEHIGSSVFKMLDIPVQETFLAKYKKDNRQEAVVVACKDFRKPGEKLIEASTVSLSVLDSNKRNRTTVSSAYKIMESTGVDIKEMKLHYWDMITVDALIGNVDRHNGNWGFLFNPETDAIKFAPVYDCGSSLSPLLSDRRMDELLKNEGLFNSEEYNVKSALRTDEGNTIFYHELFNNPPEELKVSLRRIMPKIDMNKINNFIDSVEGLSDIRKSYYKKALALRYEKILLRAHKRFNERPVLGKKVNPWKQLKDGTIERRYPEGNVANIREYKGEFFAVLTVDKEVYKEKFFKMKDAKQWCDGKNKEIGSR